MRTPYLDALRRVLVIVNFPRIFPCRIGLMSLPDLIRQSLASERGNDIVGAQEKSKEGMSNKFATRFHSEPVAAVIPGLTRNLPCTRDAEIGCKQPRSA